MGRGWWPVRRGAHRVEHSLDRGVRCAPPLSAGVDVLALDAPGLGVDGAGHARTVAVAVEASRLYTLRPMSRWLVERRLSDVSARLKRLRADLQVIDEQMLFFADTADEMRMRALVSETPLADKEHHDAQKHADAMAKERENVVASIAELEKAQDELLDKLVAETR